MSNNHRVPDFVRVKLVGWFCLRAKDKSYHFFYNSEKAEKFFADHQKSVNKKDEWYTLFELPDGTMVANEGYDGEFPIGSDSFRFTCKCGELVIYPDRPNEHTLCPGCAFEASDKDGLSEYFDEKDKFPHLNQSPI